MLRAGTPVPKAKMDISRRSFAINLLNITSVWNLIKFVGFALVLQISEMTLFLLNLRFNFGFRFFDFHQNLSFF